MEKTQKNFDKLCKTIEENSCYRYTAGTDEFSAFFVPIDIQTKQVLDTPFEVEWPKLIKLAELLKNKPLSIKR